MSGGGRSGGDFAGFLFVCQGRFFVVREVFGFVGVEFAIVVFAVADGRAGAVNSVRWRGCPAATLAQHAKHFTNFVDYVSLNIAYV